MDEHLILRNRLKTVRKEKKLSQTELAELVGVSRNTISSIETGQFNPTAKLALVLCIALDKKWFSSSFLLNKNSLFLTKEEKEYIKNKKVLKVSNLDTFTPFNFYVRTSFSTINSSKSRYGSSCSLADN